MKAHRFNKFLGLLGVMLTSGCAAGSVIGIRHSATARFHVVVTDSETGKPMEGVHVQGQFDSRHGGWGNITHSSEYDDCYTDEAGMCTLSGSMNHPGGASVGVLDLPGYYHSGAKPVYRDYSLLKLNRWQPDGQVLHLTMDKIGNPIPLYIRKVELYRTGPADPWWPEGSSIAYDFLKGDWLPPHGTGEFADMTITRQSREVLGIGQNLGLVRKEAFIDRMTIRFNGDENGILEINPHPNAGIKIRTARLSGYCREMDAWNKRDLNLVFTKNTSNHKYHCFRIRMKRDDKGEVVESYYGKMYGCFSILTDENRYPAGVEFSYYLNPTPNDRNLEWDQKTNLCKNPGELHNPEP